MNREKQIEEKHELSESIYMSGYGLLRQDCDNIAEQLLHEGYRKTSDVALELLDEIEEMANAHHETAFGKYIVIKEQRYEAIRKKYTEGGRI